jgi:hypothetical protein
VGGWRGGDGNARAGTVSHCFELGRILAAGPCAAHSTVRWRRTRLNARLVYASEKVGAEGRQTFMVDELLPTPSE